MGEVLMLRIGLCFLLLLASANSVEANDYPVRSVQIVVPFAAGGGTDVLARIVAQRLQDRWGQPVIVENQAGASGGTGTKLVMRAAPDGYTLLMASTGALMAAASSFGDNGRFDVNEHLAPIILIAAPPYVVTIHPKINAATVADLVRIAREREGGNMLTFGSSGAGAASHLTGALFQKKTGIKMLHVAYRGTGPAVNDLLGGHIDVMFAPPQTVQPLVEAGKLRAIATTGSVRSPLFPGVPTAAESGVPGFESVGWFGLLAPGHTPASIVGKLNAEVLALLQTAEVRDRLAALGAEPQPLGPEQFGTYINADIAKWSELMREIEAKQSSGKDKAE
jgi:tripartite-type tricarboxylate transporter receptor subunit TctC